MRLSIAFAQVELMWTTFIISGWTGALNTAGKATFMANDFPFLEYTDLSRQAHTMARRGEGHAPLLENL